MTKTRNLADLGGGFIQAGSNTQRTVESKLQDVVSVLDFGADPTGQTESTNAFNAAIAYLTNINSSSGSEYTPTLLLGAGKYIVDTILLDSVRGMRFVGETGQDQVASKSKTKIYWKSGSTEPHLLRLRSSSYVVFSDIFFYANGNSGKSSLIEFECNGDTTASPYNKFASSQCTFDRCCFNTNSLTWSTAAINIKSAAATSFNDCILQGDIAVKIGSDTDTPAGGTGTVTIPDGRATWTRFYRCIFRGDIIRERALGVTYDHCVFAENSVSYDAGSNYRLVSLSTSGNEEVRNEVMDSCGTDVEGVTNTNGTFYSSPSSAAASTPLFIARNNIIQGRGTHFNILAGKAVLHNNQHLYTSQPGSTYQNALRIENSPTVLFYNNDTKALEDNNTASLKSKIIDDQRATLTNDSLLLKESLAADLALTTTATIGDRIFFVTPSQIRGGVYEFSYSVGLEIATTGTYLAWFEVDGVKVKDTYHKVTQTSGSTIRITCPPITASLAATDATSGHEIAFKIRQVSAGSYSTVVGTTYASWATCRYIGA